MIGDTFSTGILHNVLSPKLGLHMVKSIASLVENQWIAEVASNPDEYSFVHPLFYQTLYDLTPAGERARLHNTIAMSIEKKYTGNPVYFALLAHQYGLAKSCRPKALEYFIRAGMFSLSNGPLSFDEGLEMLVQAKLFADNCEDIITILQIITLYRDKLMVMRTHLLEDEDKLKKKMSSVSQKNQKITISPQQQQLQNIELDRNENASGNSNNSNNTNDNSNKNNYIDKDRNKNKDENKDNNNNIPNINDVAENMKKSFLYPPKILIQRFFNCQKNKNERRVSPFRLSNSKLPIVVSTRIVEVEPTQETYKTGGCGLTIIGTNIFIKLFRQIEVDLNELHAEMVKHDKTGPVPDWQLKFRELMQNETGNLNEIINISPIAKYPKRSRSSILILAGGSIKMLTNTAESRSGSILNLLNENISDPEIENAPQGVINGNVEHSSVLKELEDNMSIDPDLKSASNVTNCCPESVTRSQQLLIPLNSESLSELPNQKIVGDNNKCVLS